MKCFSNIGQCSDDRPVMEPRLANVKKAELTKAGAAMYLAGKVRLSRANDTARAANGGKGWTAK